MTKTLKIEHQTSYSYGAELAYAVLQLRLTPVKIMGQVIEDWQCHIHGGKEEFNFTDQNGNIVKLITSEPDTNVIEIKASGTVKVNDTNGVAGEIACSTPTWLFKNQTPLTDLGNLSGDFTNNCAGDIGSIGWLHSLSAQIKDKVHYKIAETETNSSALEAVQKGLGVCQDHTHIFLGCCRSVGIPSRYVSGYLLLDDAEHQTAMHAWAEAFVPSLGWVGFDVSNGVSPDTKYVRIAQGRDYKDVAPVKGSIFGGLEELMSVNLIVQQQ